MFLEKLKNIHGGENKEQVIDFDLIREQILVAAVIFYAYNLKSLKISMVLEQKQQYEVPRIIIHNSHGIIVKISPKL